MNAVLELERLEEELLGVLAELRLPALELAHGHLVVVFELLVLACKVGVDPVQCRLALFNAKERFWVSRIKLRAIHLIYSSTLH